MRCTVRSVGGSGGGGKGLEKGIVNNIIKYISRNKGWPWLAITRGVSAKTGEKSVRVREGVRKKRDIKKPCRELVARRGERVFFSHVF